MRFLGAGGKMGFGRAGKYENIYLGGAFLSANYENQIGFVPTSRVAKWNGTQWSGFGSGMNSIVNALAFDSSGTLHAGGQFTTANGVTVNYIAKWNTVSENWEGFGSGMSARVNALAFDSSGTLHAGGQFTTAGGIEALRTAKWNGTNWEKFIDVDSTVRALLITEPT